MALFQRKSKRQYMALPVQKPRARTDDLVTEDEGELRERLLKAGEQRSE